MIVNLQVSRYDYISTQQIFFLFQLRIIILLSRTTLQYNI